MKAMVVNNWGGKSVLQSRPEPQPGPGEAVLRVRAAGVGLTLLNMRSGSFGGVQRAQGHRCRAGYVGHGHTFQAAIDSLTASGRAVIIGVGKGDVSIRPADLVQTEKIITGSRHSTRTELIETMEIMARGLVTPVVGMRVPLAEVETIFDAIRNETLLGRGALTYG